MVLSPQVVYLADDAEFLVGEFPWPFRIGGDDAATDGAFGPGFPDLVHVGSTADEGVLTWWPCLDP